MKTLLIITFLFISFSCFSQDDNEFESNQYSSGFSEETQEPAHNEAQNRTIAIALFVGSIIGLLRFKERAANYTQKINHGAPKVQYESKRINFNRLTVACSIPMIVGIFMWFFNMGPVPVIDWLKINGMKTFLTIAGFAVVLIIGGLFWLAYCRIKSLAAKREKQEIKDNLKKALTPQPGDQGWNFKKHHKQFNNQSV